MTAVKVVDASALGALLFGEPQAELVSDRLRGGRLVAPALVDYELASVCLKKIQRDPEHTADYMAAFATLGDMGIEIVPVDQVGIVPLALHCRLTSYDASYLWLAQRLGAELVTLDARLERAAEALLGQTARKPPST